MWLSALIVTAVISGCTSAKTIIMTGPDGRVKVAFNLNKEGQSAYTVTYRDTAVITEGFLGIVRSDADFSSGLKLDSVTGPEEVSGSYTLLHGKKNTVR